MIRHPGGEARTRHLLDQADFAPMDRILDMGAGDGNAVNIMKKLGVDACGIDLCPGEPDIIKGDFLNTGFSPESFDGVLSQCSFYVSGDVEAAVREAVRLLKPGGWFLFSDVWFDTEEALRQMLERNGLCIRNIEDHSEEWKEYYIESIWNGTMEAVCGGTGRCRYYSVTAGKYRNAF